MGTVLPKITSMAKWGTMARTGGGSSVRAVLLLALVGLLVAGCGVTRGEDEGLHRVRMMVPNSPGGGYDLTARTAVKIMEDQDITGRVEVFNVIGAGGTVAMARLMNESGNDDLMMMMGLGVVGAGYTNGSSARVSDATALAKVVEEQEGILVPADSPLRTIDDFVAAWQADPASVTIGGGSSPGGPDHLFPMETARAVGVDPNAVNYVSYDGGGDLLTALLGQKITAGTSGLGSTSTRSKPVRCACSRCRVANESRASMRRRCRRRESISPSPTGVESLRPLAFRAVPGPTWWKRWRSCTTHPNGRRPW